MTYARQRNIVDQNKQLVALRSDLLLNYDSYENEERQNIIMSQWTN